MFPQVRAHDFLKECQNDCAWRQSPCIAIRLFA